MSQRALKQNIRDIRTAIERLWDLRDQYRAVMEDMTLRGYPLGALVAARADITREIATLRDEMYERIRHLRSESDQGSIALKFEIMERLRAARTVAP